MSNERPTIEELISHIKKHKDAVVIIGEKVAPELGVNLVTDEDGENVFNKKALVKKPDEFWDFYFNNIKNSTTFLNTPVVYNEVKALKTKGLVSKVISTNTHGMPVADIHLKGVSNKIVCNKCGDTIENATAESLKSNNYKCTKCNGKIRPSCLLYGENYHISTMREFVSSIFKEEEGKDTVPNTHTIILIGVDMSEDLISEMYDNYLLVRERIQDKCYLVMITDKEEDIRLFTPEFATSTDIDGATKRLVDMFE